MSSQALAKAIGQVGHDLKVASLVYSESAGGNVFLDFLPQSPDVAVRVSPYGGAEPDSGLSYNLESIQITVRGTQNPVVAYNLWNEIFSKLHGATYVDLPDGAFMVYCLVSQASPVPLGPDENGRYRYTMNIRAEVVTPTENRPGPIE